MNSTRRGTVAAALAATLVATSAMAADAKPAPKRADLVVSSLVIVGGTAHPGNVLKLRDTTANAGTARAIRSSTALFLSKDAQRDAGDTKLGRRKLKRIRAGRSSLGISPISLSKTVKPGSYQLLACADGRNRVSETNELNNCRAIPLAISAVKPPGGKPGNGDGPLDHLELYPPHASVSVGSSSQTPTTTFEQLYPLNVNYQVEGYDSNGHDLGDFTEKAQIEVNGGGCFIVFCSVGTPGDHSVLASVGSASGSAVLTGVSPGMICRGENYDLDGNVLNGCESTQPFANHTTIGTAASLGAKTCNDGLFDASFSGSIYSDGHGHVDPSVPGFDSKVGSAPAWRSLQALGGACQNDVKLTVQTTGGAIATCYRVWMRFAGDPAVYGSGFYATYYVDVAGNETKTLTRGAGSYDDGTILYFEVERTCAATANTHDKVKYLVSYHL